MRSLEADIPLSAPNRSYVRASGVSYPFDASRKMRPAISLLDGSPMCRQGDHTTVRSQDGWRNLFPEGCGCDLTIGYVVDCHSLDRYWPAGIDHQGAALVIDAPLTVLTKDNILPSYFVDFIRTVSPCLKVDDTYSGVNGSEPLAMLSTRRQNPRSS